jgi:filamentous hemagglutinin
MTLNGGLVLSTGTIGIVVPDGASTITGGLMMAGGSGSVQLAALTQTGGTVSANGSIAVAGALAQSGGTLAAAGDVVLGALMQSAGTVSAGGMVAIGAGTGIAGDIGSNATSGGFEQTGGVLVATGDIAIWTTGTASQSAGTLAAGGQVGLTAGGALSQSHAGLLSGAGGVALLANGGDAAQDATALVAGGAVTVQAPAGDVSFVNVALAGTVAAAAASITAAPVAALAAPAPAAQTASSRVTVTLAGDTISILRDLTAGQLTLTSSAATQQTAGTVIDADTLSGSAGSATLGTLADPSGATELGSNANRIAVLGDYATTGALSLTDATVLTVTGPVQAGTSLRIGTAGALSVTGTITAGNALLLANENLFNPGNPVSAAAADLAIAGSVATAGTLTLWAERNLDATGAVAAALLTGRAGVLAADTTLPQNFRANLVGSADLTGANTVATLGTLLATGGVVFADTQASGTLSVTGPVTAGDGTLAASDAVLTVAGNQVVTGIVSAPAGSASLEATGDVTLTGGVVRGSTVILATTGDKILNSGLIASTGAGIDLTGGATVMYGGTISATSTGSLTTAALTQDGGTISANGSAGLASLTQSAGTLATVGNIAIAGALSQSGGTVSTGGTLSLGTGTGTAGLGGSAASAGALQQTGGTLLGSGDIVLWSASPAVSQQSGVIAAGGRVGMTAEAGIAQQGGTISGAGGVALLANTGDLTQDATGVLAGPAATGAGPGVMVLAPQGNTDAVTVLLAGAVGTATPASTGSVAAVSLGPLGAQAAARVDVLLLGDSIVLDKNLTAGTLGLYSLGDTQLDAGQVIDALVLQGSAGWSTGWSVPAATGWTGAPLGWTAGTGSAVLGSTGVPLTTADQTLSNLNLIPTVASYAATGNLSLADAGALEVTGPVQVAGSATLAAGGTLTLAGNLAAADALLIANHALGTLTAAADLLLPGTVVVPGTLELWAERDLTATGPITAGVLAARAGGLAADTTLPTNFRHDLVGTIALTGSNAIATIGPVLATGNVTIDTATTALSGPVVAGYGGLVAAPSLDLQVAGDLTATGQVTSPGGTATIAATGAITLTDALVFAPTSVAITAGTAYAQTGGTVFSDSVTVAAPARTLDGGAILAPGPAARIDLAGGSTTVTDAGVISAGGAAALVSFGTLSLASGTVASAGALQADAVVQQAGTIAAVGNAQFGNLQQQTGGLLAVGGNLTVGTGTGTAGQVGSQAATGAATAAGSVDVAGTLTLWSAGSIGLSGTVLAGRVLATAATGIDQSAGTLVGGTGVALLTTGGDAVQDAPSGAVLAGGATDGVAVRAPLGTVSFGNITLPGGTLPAPPSVSLAAPSLTCTACTVPLPWIGTVLPASTVTVPAPVLTAQPATSGIPDVTLAGATIQQDPPQGLTAGTLSLFATHAIDEQGTLVADVLTGTAGLAQPAEGLSATDPAAWVHLDGSANSIATLGDVTSTGVLRLTDAQPLAIPDSTISAPLIRLLVTDAITIQGGVFITGGETGLPPRGGLATDPTDATYTDDSQRGLYISFTGTTGQVSQTGLTQLQPIGALPALLRIDLPLGTSNSVSFDPRNGLDYGLFGRTAAVFLHLGDGWASGNINVGQLSVIYASVPPIQTRMTGTLLSAEGVVIDSQLAASLASIGTSNGQFLPSGIFQLNGCALTSSDCVMMGGHDSVPVQSPLRPIDFGSPLDPNEDPDLLAPDISDRDY